MNLLEFESKLNGWGRERVPFLFLIDFEMERSQAWKLNEVPDEILFLINRHCEGGTTEAISPLETSSVREDCFAIARNDEKLELKKFPISFEEYKKKFALVKNRISFGDSYLTNLTIKTKIELNRNLEDLFFLVNAKYKIYWKENFLCFSPETFVKIEDGIIFSFPMKGTIDASIPNAEEIILNDPKELSEHVTIVDLIRNDLSTVASDVKVERFRYVEKIKTIQKNLLQVSSEISGKLQEDYLSKLGSILISLLPAGSVSGAPKNKTLQIISKAEKEKRGYYTGVVGYFDGKDLDSGVLIRFIEQDKDQFYYRSGGGITSQSKVGNEYQEMIDKIYVPVH